MPYVDDFTLDDSIEKYRLIESCPFCDKKLIYKEDKKKCTLTCTNENCPGIRQQKLIYFLKSINFKGVGEKKIESLGDDSTLANCVKKYKLEESIIETLKRTTVRDLFVAMNFGGARQVEKYLEKTSLATYMLMPIFTCMDEVIAEVERYNKNNFAKECSLTILELMKSNKN
jgi:NAD-dependent DNA ligase